MAEDRITSPELSAILAHHKRRETVSIEVPEWGEGDEPLRIYATPMTIEDQQKINRVPSGDPARLVEVLIVKARRADGTRMFTIADRRWLLGQADPYVLADAVDRLTRALLPASIGDHVKN